MVTSASFLLASQTKETYPFLLASQTARIDQQTELLRLPLLVPITREHGV